jgi:hypothetical protein
VPDFCLANQTCTPGSSITPAWTCTVPSGFTRLCPSFFECATDKAGTMLHEFVHHTGVGDQFYVFQTAGFSGLSPNGTGGVTDSLNNADSYAGFATGVK